jgi:DNA-binding NarL/FixJ family response regulator
MREMGNAPAAPPMSIVLIDPKPLTRRSLLEMLAKALPDHETLLGASGYEELMGDQQEYLLLHAKPHIFILYIRNAGVSDTWVQDQLQRVRLGGLETLVIMISDRDDAEDVVKALDCGVRGYIPTSIAAEVAIAALTLIEAGGTYIPVGALRPEGVQAHIEADEPTRALETLNLTSRELAVIDLLREGKPNKVIARQLNMQESTVKVHVRNILKKLRASNRTHAASVANRLFAHATSGSSVTVDDKLDDSMTRDTKAVSG